MAFRWKTQMGPSQAEVASQQMAGYNPQQQRGVPFQSAPGGMQPPPDMTGYGESLQAASDRAGVLQQIEEKEARLASIEAKIADIDRQYPELKDGGQQWEIAAKRAEIGDMSAYDSMMARGQQAGAQSSAIESELKAAEKLLWGLTAKSDEDRAMTRNQIEVALRSAEEWQDKTGQQLPDSYYRLKDALGKSGGNGGMNAREYANDLSLKIYRGTASDEDVEKGIAWAEANKNSDEAKMILEAAQAARPKTQEAKKKAQAAAEKSAEEKQAAIDEWYGKIGEATLKDAGGSVSKTASNGNTVTITLTPEGILYKSGKKSKIWKQ